MTSTSALFNLYLQVEVYSNTTQLWNKVQSSSKEMYPTIQRDGVNDHKNMSQWMMPDRKVENEESATDKKRLDENMFEKPLYELLDIYSKCGPHCVCIK